MFFCEKTSGVTKRSDTLANKFLLIQSGDFEYIFFIIKTDGSGPEFSCECIAERTTQLQQLNEHLTTFLFLVSHCNFLFVPCGELSWLPVSFLLHVKHTLSYRIVQQRL